jgi:hypothetical protein
MAVIHSADQTRIAAPKLIRGSSSIQNIGSHIHVVSQHTGNSYGAATIATSSSGVVIAFSVANVSSSRTS